MRRIDRTLRTVWFIGRRPVLLNQILRNTRQACQAGSLHRGLLLRIGFMEKMLYTAQITFGKIGFRSERQYHGHESTQPDLRQQKRS